MGGTTSNERPATRRAVITNRPGTPRLQNDASRVLQPNWRTPVFTLPIAIATGVVAFAAGWLWSARTLHRLRKLLELALWTCGHDQLTGLPNRGNAEHLFGRRAAAGRPTVIALLDLDRFKQVNDTYGHGAGDQLLVAVAGRLAQAAAGRPTVIALLDLDRFKQVNDTYGHGAGDQLLVAVAGRLAQAAAGYGGHAARLSGDEFLLLLPIHPGNFLHPVATILREIATPVQITTEEAVTLTPAATAGASWFDGVNGSWDRLLRQADLALYHARACGLAYEPYRPGMRMPDRPHRRGQRLRDQHREASA
ncbi:MAG: diguanylate cyclase [Micromonosporaceae bacterium]|nr:diguanylate cyclase [Micromonosporaceae bacterium]